MSTVLDWTRFQTGPVSPERAFEAFTAQVFERWLNREHGPRIARYVLQGAGGDGGVEAFATIDDQTVFGLQAKWFPGNLDDSHIKQVRESIDTACTRYPNLRVYIVALPRNLTKGTPGQRGRMRKGGVERWAEMLPEVATAHPDLEVVRWDESGLLDQLAKSGNQELKAVWFDGELTIGTLLRAWEKSKARLGQRYLPDLHATGRLEEVIASDLWSPEWLAEAIAAIDKCVSALDQSSRALDDFRQVTQVRGVAEIGEALGEANATVSGLRAHAQVLRSALGRGPMWSIVRFPKTPDFSRLSDLIERFKREQLGYHAGELCERAVVAATEVQERLAQIDQRLREADRPRLVVGPAGCGKTHGVAHAVHVLMSAKCPAVLLHAKGADPTAGVAQLLRDALDVPGWPLRRILDGLESLAILAHIQPDNTDGPVGFTRALLVLDGLEEAPGWMGWAAPLAEMVVEAGNRPRLHTLVTARPETVRMK